MRKNWKNFKEHELVCSHTGLFNPNPEFQVLMDYVQMLRDEVGFALPISSAYRHPTHPIEAKKASPGQHTIAAIDIQVSGKKAHKVLEVAMRMGFTGIGISQKGPHGKRFIHLDIRAIPWIWSY